MPKLAKSTFPKGHTKDDFKCFGPPATKDGVFEGTMLCDMGCFNQGEKGDDEAVDSNKYYHGAVVQSKKDGSWYTYFEYGRVGVTNPQFQFLSCSSQADAQAEYCKQLHSKNDKRGEWYTHSVLGKILRPKKGKDCYLVRPQATRSTGLPDARTITTTQTTTVVKGSTSKSVFDDVSTKLLSDLNVGTISYTRSSMVGNALPTQEAIDEARLILSHAQQIINTTNDNKELAELTKLLYSRIPKTKSRTETDWVLDANKINVWQQDVDAYEAAVAAASQSTTTVSVSLPFCLRHIKQSEKLYKFVSKMWLNATRNQHSYLNKQLKIVNIFEIDRKRDEFISYLKSRGDIKSLEVPLHQPTEREDLDKQNIDIFNKTKTWMLFHGTRSVNVAGIMNENFRLPKTLSGVVITGAAFGSGIYFADDIKKSVGYTSYKDSYWSHGGGAIKDRGAFMFICDVMIGNPHLAKHSYSYQGPPSGCDSIFAKIGVSTVQNNEFIVFDSRMANLRYLVEFE